jgi:hypothetical protein
MPMTRQLKLGDITVEVTRKPIKNIHLSVHLATGRVRISAPAWMSLENIRLFAASKLGWIKKQQGRLRRQDRDSPGEYLERQNHCVWGKHYPLTVAESNRAPAIELKNDRIWLRVRPGTDERRRQALMECWYRRQVKEALPPLIEKWQSLMGVSVNRFFVQRMKTRWGSCNPVAGNIRLNTELAQKPPEFLEYVVVHEMLHLLEPTHNYRFKALLDSFLPGWRSLKDQLNRR